MRSLPLIKSFFTSNPVHLPCPSAPFCGRLPEAPTENTEARRRERYHGDTEEREVRSYLMGRVEQEATERTEEDKPLVTSVCSCSNPILRTCAFCAFLRLTRRW